MKKFLLVIFIFSVCFAISVRPSIPEITVGETVELLFTIYDDLGNPYSGNVNVEISAGGFTDEDILLEGTKVKNGVLPLEYVAAEATDVSLTLIFESGERKEFVFPVFSKPPVNLPEASFTVIEFAGNVAYRESEKSSWKPVKVGLHVFEEFEVGCSQNSYAKLVGPNGAVVEITPESVIKFERIRSDGENVLVSVNVTVGEAIFKIIKKLSKMSKFVVKADSVTAGVRGTVFSVENSDEVHVRTFEGEVWVELPGMFVKVVKGMKFGIDKMALKVMRDFEMRSRKIWMEFREKAQKAWKMIEEISPFEGFFEEPFEMKPLDRALESYEEMFKMLRKMRGGCKRHE